MNNKVLLDRKSCQVMARIPPRTGNHRRFHVGMINPPYPQYLPSLSTLPTFPTYCTYLTYLTCLNYCTLPTFHTFQIYLKHRALEGELFSKHYLYSVGTYLEQQGFLRYSTFTLYTFYDVYGLGSVGLFIFTIIQFLKKYFSSPWPIPGMNDVW
jgi:hypothetical protein